MAIFVRYRTIIAALLLLLYAWAAMPVQWWHHHSTNSFAVQLSKYNGERKTSAGTPAEALAKAGDAGKHNTSFTDDCPICAHQYAAHDGIAFSVTIASPVIHPVFQTAHNTCWPSVSSDLLSNKGPPVLI